MWALPQSLLVLVGVHLASWSEAAALPHPTGLANQQPTRLSESICSGSTEDPSGSTVSAAQFHV